MRLIILLEYTSRTDNDIERVQVIFVCDVGIVLLALHRILGKDTAFQCYGGCRPVIRCHRVGKGNDKVEFPDVHQAAVSRAQHLLGGIVHRYGCRIGKVPETTGHGPPAHAVV